MKNLKFKANLAEIKSKIKKHAPELMVFGYAMLGAAGWVVAGVYAQKLQKTEENYGVFAIDEDGWPRISISPNAFQDVQNGATLMLRQFEEAPGRTFVQFTTRPEGFPAEADKKFNEYNKNAGATTLPEN